MCNETFIPTNGNQKFCGSKTNKTGCSWINATKVRSKTRWQNPEYRAYQREYGKKWKQEQREQDTPYAQRVRKSKRERSRNPEGREVINSWRRRNTDKVLDYNRKRELLLRNVEGSHTLEQWIKLKERFNNRCVDCNITEDELKVKYHGTNFTKLTRDHIIPLVCGGTDNIVNIQPMCVSCNSRKHSHLEVVA